MLVDDERLYVESLAKVLRRRGFEVVVAFDGGSAIALAAEQDPDVIVLDLRMPDQDGIVTMGDMLKVVPHTPVILLTGHADLESATSALNRGAADVLLKPCPVEVLVPAIENAAERKAVSLGVAAAR
jgi:DNA-binding NtrC family response regulator